MLVFIFSISISSYEKKDVATTTATLRTKEVVLSQTVGNTNLGKPLLLKMPTPGKRFKTEAGPIKKGGTTDLRFQKIRKEKINN